MNDPNLTEALRTIRSLAADQRAAGDELQAAAEQYRTAADRYSTTTGRLEAAMRDVIALVNTSDDPAIVGGAP